MHFDMRMGLIEEREIGGIWGGCGSGRKGIYACLLEGRILKSG